MSIFFMQNYSEFALKKWFKKLKIQYNTNYIKINLIYQNKNDIIKRTLI